ncbi:hypothetical protein FD19_GL000971 [Lacticaseibacillus thailandensis DSM 22698 = JCM 13996]|uniref:Maltose/galactoside acetyltransferase domain-containing protein n=1 Tax=Lacticaseibacillus thailandensis DSM 22698 = JCM 13996 TaxID=1423810 RepID=A0A0R2C7V8_9LACO|nr:hypothetical protein FD19_GL000971 [Lacticaseibacillus thailandensis DSM 22698 = JCM 13996]
MPSELDKLRAGEWFCFTDAEVAARKAHAAKLCQEFNAIPATEPKKQTKKMQEILGSYGPNLSVPAKPIRQLSEE